MSKLSSKILNSIQNTIKKNDSNEIIGLHEPFFEDTKSLDYLKECIDSRWVSSSGKWVKQFENKIKLITGANFAIAVSNGTVGLRLALHTIGVKYGEEVLIPPLSFVATANAVSHLGASPHFVDVEKESLGICPIALEKRLDDIAFKKNGQVFNRETGKRIAAIVPVHVFGNPADLSSIQKISKKWGIPIIEDSAEALGSWCTIANKRIHCGLIGDVGVISFNGNKLITTGGGGVLITNNEKLADKIKHLSTTAKVQHKWEFDHDQLGWNDRLPNLNAALGFAQLEVLEKRLLIKKKLFEEYKKNLNQINEIEFVEAKNNSISNNWLVTISFNINQLSKLKSERYELLNEAHKLQIMLRPIWKPLHKLNFYNKAPRGNLNCTEDREYRIINLPSSPQLLK